MNNRYLFEKLQNFKTINFEIKAGGPRDSHFMSLVEEGKYLRDQQMKPEDQDSRRALSEFEVKRGRSKTRPIYIEQDIDFVPGLLIDINSPQNISDDNNSKSPNSNIEANNEILNLIEKLEMENVELERQIAEKERQHKSDCQGKIE